jgi:hypothetical protein
MIKTLNRYARTGYGNKYRLFGRRAFIGNEPELSFSLATLQEFRLRLHNLLI